MKTLWALAAATLLTAASPSAANPASEIAAANARWTKAVAAKDMASVQTLVAPEFRLTFGDAKQAVNRATWLANLSKMQITSYATEITDLEVHGDTAISTVTGSWDVAIGTEKRRDKFQLLDVWVRRASGWQVARRHITGE